MKISSLTEEAINQVMSDLSPSCWKEAILMRVSREGFIAKYRKMIGKPFAMAFYNGDNRCEAIGYVEDLGPYRWRTHFAVTSMAFKKMGLSLTRFLKGITDRMMGERWDAYIELLSVPSPEVAAWYGAIGFRLKDSQDGVSKYVKVAR